MATYLIDYENVKSEGIKGVAQLGEDDRVVIFYSHNADTITFEAMDMIFSSKAQISKYKILCGGKNALDFQLSTYLGYLIHEAKDSYFYIISKDNGFKHVVDFWKRTFQFDGYVYCFATIADGNARQNRFKNASAKERARVMEEELFAMSEELEAQSDAEEAEETENTENAQEQETTASEGTPTAEATNAVQPQEVFTAPEEESVKAPVTDDAATEPTEAISDENVIEKAAEIENAEHQPDSEESSDAAVEETEEAVEEAQTQVTEQSSENSEAKEPIKEAVIYPVQQHKPVSVMPPAQLPESIREKLEKADAQYQESVEADLQEKIDAAVSVPTVKVVESGMTVHHVEESEPVQAVVKPGKARKASKTAKSDKTEKTQNADSNDKNQGDKTEKAAKSEKTVHHVHRSGRRKKNVEQAIETIVPAQVPVTEEAQKKEETLKAPKAPKTAKVSKEEASKEETPNAEGKVTDKEPKKIRQARTRTPKVVKEPKEAATETESISSAEEEKPVQKKTVRRGRRPKAQSNIAANFE